MSKEINDVVCLNCGYTNETVINPTYCVYCHGAGKNCVPYKIDTDKIIRQCLLAYAKKPDPLNKDKRDADSEIRKVLRQALAKSKGDELSDEDAMKPADPQFEKWVDYVIEQQLKLSDPVGTSYEEINSSLARFTRLAILGFNGQKPVNL